MNGRRALAFGVVVALALSGAVTADDDGFRIGQQPASDDARLVVLRGATDMLRFCEPGETAADGCIKRHAADDDEDDEAPEARREEERRRRAEPPDAAGSRSVTVAREAAPPDGFTVRTEGAPTAVTLGAGGPGRVSLRAGERGRIDGTDPSPPPPGGDDPSTAHRDLFAAGRRPAPPALAVDATLAPSGVLSISQ